MRLISAIGFLIGLSTQSGCDLIQGLQPASLATAGGSGGEAVTTAGTGAGGADTGTTSSSTGSVCTPGEQIVCYTGPAGTEKNAQCQTGLKSCKDDGSGFKDECVGEVTPTAETCGDAADENCDGYDCAYWAVTFGDENVQSALAIRSDSAGNAYVLGTFQGAVQFNDPPLISAGGLDFFLVKLDPAGVVQWSKRFGNAADQTAATLDVDPLGNVVIGGKLTGMLDFGGGALSGKEIFVARFNSDGEHQWSKALQAGTPWDARVAIQPDSTVILWTDFLGAANFGGAALSSPTERKAVLVAFKDNGDFNWQKLFVGAGDPSGNSARASDLHVDSAGNISLSGIFGGKTFNLGGSDLAGVQEQGGSYFGLFIARFDSFGDHAWSAVDPVNAAIAGDSLGGIASAALADDLVPCTSAVVKKRNTLGNQVWSHPIACPTQDAPLMTVEVGADGSANTIVAINELAIVAGTALDFVGHQLPAVGKADLILGKLDPGGNHLWSKRFGVPNESQGDPVITTAPNGDILLAAQVSGAINVGTGELPVPPGAKDLLIARFAP